MGIADILVITPTYNEVQNVGRMIEALIALPVKADILVIDDASPDGTAEVVRGKAREHPGRIHLIERSGKQGLGTAYVIGFQYGLDHGYTYLCEIDADFSHNPDDIPRLLDEVKSDRCDLAIGSRYCKGISIVNWPLSRLILSYAANFYARFVTNLPIHDTTAGFKCLHRRVVEQIDLSRVRSNGYAFQIEMHYRAWKAGFRINEVSIIFRERQEGTSKMSRMIVLEAIWRVWTLRVRSILGLL